MGVIFHPLVRNDVSEILRYYQTISPRLSQEFHEELKEAIDRAAANPERFHFTEKGLRRVNLKRFPHHFLYDVRAEGIRVLLVRHNKRGPQYGLDRL